MDPMNSEERPSDSETCQNGEQGKHFSSRRKILAGLAGVPVLVTFAPNASAVSSFGRCVGHLNSGSADLSAWFKAVDQNGTPINPLTVYQSKNTDGICSGTVISSACLTSFVGSGGVLPQNSCTVAAANSPSPSPRRGRRP